MERKRHGGIMGDFFVAVAQYCLLSNSWRCVFEPETHVKWQVWRCTRVVSAQNKGVGETGRYPGFLSIQPQLSGKIWVPVRDPVSKHNYKDSWRAATRGCPLASTCTCTHRHRHNADIQSNWGRFKHTSQSHGTELQRTSQEGRKGWRLMVSQEATEKHDSKASANRDQGEQRSMERLFHFRQWAT